MSNIDVIAIINTYGVLKSTTANIDHIKKLVAHKIYIMVDNTVDELIGHADNIKQRKYQHDTLLLFLTGHGGYDYKNNKEYINLIHKNKYDTIPFHVEEIVSYFDYYKNIIVFMDTCQLTLPNKYKMKNNTQSLKSNVILCCAASKNKKAYGSNNGGCFTTTICETLSDYVRTKEFVELHVLLNHINAAYVAYISKYTIIPEIYVINLGYDNITFDKFTDLTKQKSISITARSTLSNQKGASDSTHYLETTNKEEEIIKLHISAMDYDCKSAKKKLESFYENK